MTVNELIESVAPLWQSVVLMIGATWPWACAGPGCTWR